MIQDSSQVIELCSSHLDISSSYQAHLYNLSKSKVHSHSSYYSSYYNNDWDDWDDYDYYDGYPCYNYSSSSFQSDNNETDENGLTKDDYIKYDNLLSSERMISYYPDYTNPYDVITFDNLYELNDYLTQYSIDISEKVLVELLDSNIIHCSINPKIKNLNNKSELIFENSYSELRYTCADLDDL